MYIRICLFYTFGDFITYPRGYDGIFHNKAVSLSATYTFPLACPDWRLGPVLYIKRIKAALFYDHAINLDQAGQPYYNSAGLDLTFDFHVVSFLAPFDAGVRCIYFPQTGTFDFTPLFRINLDSLY